MSNAKLDNLADDDVAVLPPKPAKGKTRVIMLEENDNIPPTGQFIQYGAGTTEKSFILRPGEEVEVPIELTYVLDAAVQEVPQVDPITRQVVGYRPRLRFPYRVIRDAA